MGFVVLAEHQPAFFVLARLVQHLLGDVEARDSVDVGLMENGLVGCVEHLIAQLCFLDDRLARCLDCFVFLYCHGSSSSRPLALLGLRFSSVIQKASCMIPS